MPGGWNKLLKEFRANTNIWHPLKKVQEQNKNMSHPNISIIVAFSSIQFLASQTFTKRATLGLAAFAMPSPWEVSGIFQPLVNFDWCKGRSNKIESKQKTYE